jgi:serine protease AprX
MNLSLGRPVYESYTLDPLCQAVEAAWKAGIVVVVAAGNEGRDNSSGNAGYGTITAPGNDPYVITVGAMKTENTDTRTDDLIASYSSKGPTAVDQIVKPDIVAPGNLVVSLLAQHGRLPLTYPQNGIPLSYYQSNAPGVGAAPTMPAVPTNPNVEPPAVNFGPGMSNVYYTLSGTSMAAAVVSGAVADLLQAFPNLNPDQVKLLIMQTSYKTFPISSTATDPGTGTPYVDYYDIFTVGSGYLDLQAALAAARSVPNAGTAMSPSSSYDPTSGLVTLNYDPSSVWANPSLQGTRCLWGTSAIYSSSTLQGNQANLTGAKCLWGTSTDSATKSLWGTSTTSASGGLLGTNTETASSMIAGEN